MSVNVYDSVADESEIRYAFDYAQTRSRFTSGAERRKWAREASRLLVQLRSASMTADCARIMRRPAR